MGKSKQCAKCNVHLPYDCFNATKSSKDGRHSYCKPCASASHRMRKYGVTKEWYDTTLAAQDGTCDICDKHLTPGAYHKYFIIDHDHDTGSVRGLLCSNCNLGIGQLNDDIGLLVKAIDYLVKHKK